MAVSVVTVVVAVVVLIVAVPQLDAVEKKVIKYFCLLADLCLSLFNSEIGLLRQLPVFWSFFLILESAFSGMGLLS